MLATIIIIVILAVLSIVVYAAATEKTIGEVLDGIVVLLHPNNKDPEEPPKPIPPVPTPIKTSDDDPLETITVSDPGGTRPVAGGDLYLDQLTADGDVLCRHSICRDDFRDADGNLVGVAVSRPTAFDEKGIHLKGKMVNGVYDTNDKVTNTACTVNAGAFTIAEDENGFYGQVTNPKAKLSVFENGSLTRVPFGEYFSIENGTIIRCGAQWMTFGLPEEEKVPEGVRKHSLELAGLAVADEPADESDEKSEPHTRLYESPARKAEPLPDTRVALSPRATRIYGED